MRHREFVQIPITNTARTYGYIIWRKKDDEQMEKLLSHRESVNLRIGDSFQKKRVDRKGRRISIGYRLTRGLPKDLKLYRLVPNDSKDIVVSFH